MLQITILSVSPQCHFSVPFGKSPILFAVCIMEVTSKLLFTSNIPPVLAGLRIDLRFVLLLYFWDFPRRCAGDCDDEIVASSCGFVPLKSCLRPSPCASRTNTIRPHSPDMPGFRYLDDKQAIVSSYSKKGSLLPTRPLNCRTVTCGELRYTTRAMASFEPEVLKTCITYILPPKLCACILHQVVYVASSFFSASSKQLTLPLSAFKCSLSDTAQAWFFNDVIFEMLWPRKRWQSFPEEYSQNWNGYYPSFKRNSKNTAQFLWCQL